MNKIVHFSILHSRNDTRIWLKEAVSLAEALRLPVEFHVQDSQVPSDPGSANPRVVSTGLRPANKWLRLTVGHLRMLRSVWRANPTVAHFHDPELIPVGIILKVLGVKVLYDVHEDTPKQLLARNTLSRQIFSRLVAIIESIGMLLFDGFIAATPAIARRFPPNKTIVVQNFPLESEFETVDCDDTKRIAYQFCFVGGVTRIRGFEEMLRAMELVNAETARLVIAGKFSEGTKVPANADRAGWSRIIESGWLDRPQVMALMSSSLAGLVVFHPVPNHLEAQPNKLFEYMSAGLPVIASDFPLWRDIIESAGCGILVDPLDPAAIAKAIDWMCVNQDEARRMGARGRAAIEGKYNWKNECKALVEGYSELLELGPSRD
jgi:glycosyltransferase involved in cell wall biosynthesis